MSGRPRTDDIASGADSFAELLLPASLTSALTVAGFIRPSPVQAAAIPLARLGVDLIVQAKSGTGKTLVYAVAALERVVVDILTPQVVIVTPTREIALQSHEVITRVQTGLNQPSLRTVCFIGGQPYAEDEKRLRRTCHIVVGTPGRLCALREAGKLPVAALRLFVLDEADSLLAESFIDDVDWMRQTLPSAQLQTLALSATYTPEMLELLEDWMEKPERVMLCEETVTLKGVKHFFVSLDTPPASEDDSSKRSAALALKLPALVDLMSGMTFNQAVVFCNNKSDGEWVSAKLTAAAFPAAHISGSRSQQERTSTMSDIRGFKSRVLVSTDLTARGVDLERVNLVVNLDLPQEAATLLHRVGRTGRWGSHGVAVTFCIGEELQRLHNLIQEAGGGELQQLPDHISEDLYRFDLETAEEQEQLQLLIDAPLLPDPDEVAALEEVAEWEEQEEGNDEDVVGEEAGAAAWDHEGYYNYYYGGGWQQQQQQAWLGHEYWQGMHLAADGRQQEYERGEPEHSPPLDQPVSATETGKDPEGASACTNNPSAVELAYRQYVVDYAKWTGEYNEWRDQYRLWLYNFHMEAAYRTYYSV